MRVEDAQIYLVNQSPSKKCIAADFRIHSVYKTSSSLQQRSTDIYNDVMINTACLNYLKTKHNINNNYFYIDGKRRLLTTKTFSRYI